MAAHLKKGSTNKAIRDISGRNMQRWMTYMRRFKKTLKASENETGLGLTKRELELGISIPEKLDRMCPQFQRMKALFGGRANITPALTLELGVPQARQLLPAALAPTIS